MLPPGRLKLVTSPCSTGSLPVTKTIGIVVVARLAGRPAGVLVAAITLTCRRTRSAANSGRRLYWPLAQRYSISTFCPSMYPASPRPHWNARTKCIDNSAAAPFRKPITGIGRRCAPATIGHAAATPVINANSRRLMSPSPGWRLRRRYYPVRS